MSFLSAIILAAGRGQRMQAGCNKALLPLADKPVLCYALEMWRGLAGCIVVAAAAADLPQVDAMCAPYGAAVRLVEGGPNRAASLARALAVLPAKNADATQELVAVHDAARPLTMPADIRRVIAAAEQYGAAILAAPVTDTIRYRADDGPQKQADGLCGEIVPRGELLAAQTPQIFRRDWLTAAYAEADEAQLATVTDDAALLQAQGRQCAYVWAGGLNLKLTTPEDMIIAEAIIMLR